MVNYPPYTDGKPPIISMENYDVAEWSKTTCLDPRADGYYVVEMEHPEKVVALIDKKDNELLDRIVRSAKQNYEKNSN